MTLLLWLSLPLIPIDIEKPGWSLASVVPFCATELTEQQALAEISTLLFVEPAYCLVCGLASPFIVP